MGHARLKDAQQMGKPQWFPSGTNPLFCLPPSLSPRYPSIILTSHNISLSVVSWMYPFLIKIVSINPSVRPPVPLFIWDCISLYSDCHINTWLCTWKMQCSDGSKMNWPETEVKGKHCILIWMCCLLERQQKAFIWRKGLRTDISHSQVNVRLWTRGAEGFERVTFWVPYKNVMVAMYFSVIKISNLTK